MIYDAGGRRHPSTAALGARRTEAGACAASLAEYRVTLVTHATGCGRDRSREWCMVAAMDHGSPARMHAGSIRMQRWNAQGVRCMRPCSCCRGMQRVLARLCVDLAHAASALRRARCADGSSMASGHGGSVSATPQVQGLTWASSSCTNATVPVLVTNCSSSP